MSNSQKTPLQQSLHALVDVKAQDWLARLAKSMPATITKINGALVTVKLEGSWNPFTIPEITIPVAGSKYVREPLQVGDKGFVIGVDYYLGGQSGEGGGNADLLPRANLTNSVFQSVTQKGFPSVDGDTLILTGKKGAELQSGNTNTTLAATDVGIAGNTDQGATLTATKTITLHAGQAFTLQSDTDLLLEVAGVKIELTSSGATLTGNVTLNGDEVVNGTTTFDGNMNVQGALHSTGAISTDQSVSATHDIGAGGNVTATGDITTTAGTVTGHEIVSGHDVQAVNDVITGGGITLNTHRHVVTSAPGNTGLPFG